VDISDVWSKCNRATRGALVFDRSCVVGDTRVLTDGSRQRVPAIVRLVHTIVLAVRTNGARCGAAERASLRRVAGGSVNTSTSSKLIYTSSSVSHRALACTSASYHIASAEVHLHSAGPARRTKCC